MLHAVENKVFLTALPDPFRTEKICARLEYGDRVSDLVLAHIPAGAMCMAHVWINGEYVPSAMWASVRPKAGTVVVIRAVPQGGGGGGGKSPLRMVLSLAIMMAAPGIGAALGGALGMSANGLWLGSTFLPGISGIGILSAGVGIVGQLALSALTPPPSSGGSGAGIVANAAEKPTLFISGGRNKVLPLGRIPRPLGRHRMLPPMGALPYTETAGSDQYLRMLFIWGYGPLEISDIRIGDTSIAAFDDVEIETRQGYDDDEPLTLYTDDVNQADLAVTLTQEGGWQLRTTEAAVNEISVDITFQNGLFELNAAGQRVARTVEVDVEYSPTGADTWTAVTGFAATASQGSALRLNTVFPVDQGQYDVRLRRTTADTVSDQIYDGVAWTALRSITHISPVLMTGLAMTAIRIKGTDQLSGIVDQLNGIVHSILPDWDSEEEEWVEQATANPAALFRYVLQGNANARPLADSRVDLEALQAWHEACADEGREYNAVIDGDNSVRGVLDGIAAAGRAAIALVNGKWGIVRDTPQTVPVQHFTPRNTFGFRGEKRFSDLPHGFKVRFINRAKDWQPDERIVYDDGYDANNATKFEGMDLPGVTDPDHVWKDGRYHIATARLRPETYSFGTDIEHIACTRGDLIRFTHDVPLHGLGTGRIKSLTLDGSDITDITLDQLFTMEDEKTYNVRIRTITGESILAAVDTEEGETDTLTFTTPIAAENGPAVGDLALFGETDEESVELIVRSIEPMSDLTARITCVPAAPAVHDAETGAIPAYDSQVTVPPDMRRPPAPVISKVQSGNDVLVISTGGNYVPSIIVTLDTPSYYGSLTPVVFVRGAGETVFRPAAASTSDNKISILDVQAGQSYDISIYYKNQFGTHSASLLQEDIAVTGGQGTPPVVASFTAQQNGGTIVFKWSEVIWYALKGYDILYGPQGGTVAGALFLTEAARGTEMTNASVPPGSWTFYIRARDFADQLSATATAVNLVVSNENTEIFSRAYNPDWIGNAAESAGFYLHWTGKLIPMDQNTAADYGWEAFDEFVPTPVAACTFTGNDVDAGFSSQMRVWNNIGTMNGPGESGTPDVGFLLAASDSPFGGVYDFEEFNVGFVTARYLAGQLVYAPVAGSVSYIDLFKMTSDAQLLAKTINNFAVDVAGTTLTFADYGIAFHDEPNVQATVSGGSGTSAVAINVTLTEADIVVYSGATGVAGTTNITITGV